MTSNRGKQWLRVLWVACLCVAPAVALADTVTLTDSSGLTYYVNENITFSTTSSASGAMSEASYEASVAATTISGGTTMTQLGDAFDGYLALAITQEEARTTAAPSTGVAGMEFFRNNGVSGVNSCSDREISYPTQTMLTNFSVTRRVYVPADDTFARHLDSITNNAATEQTVYIGFGNNLGSDSNTVIVTSSSGDASVTTADTWVTTFQNFSGTTSSDPRLGHVLQGAGTVSSPVHSVNFANGDDNPFWWYALTLQPGETGRILTFVTGQPSRAAAASKAAELAALQTNPRSLACITPTERRQIRNFNTVCALDADLTTACDDGNLCTSGDTCGTLNTCAGVALECRSGASDCTGVCNPSTGSCEETNVPDGTACNDADACNGDDTCSAGACSTHAGALDCADTNVCTNDTCNAASGCMHTMIAMCMACATNADCDDENACNGTETCDTETSMCAASTALDCDDANDCTADSCEAATGCTHTPITTGACAPDGGMGDGGTTDMGGGTDAGRTDAGPTSDGGVTVDASSSITTRDSGCGCRVAGGESHSPRALLILALLGVAIVWRRRASRR